MGIESEHFARFTVNLFSTLIGRSEIEFHGRPLLLHSGNTILIVYVGLYVWEGYACAADIRIYSKCEHVQCTRFQTTCAYRDGTTYLRLDSRLGYPLRRSYYRLSI